MSILQPIFDRFGDRRSPQPTTTRTRPTVTGDPVDEAAAETSVFPDQTDFLPAPTDDGGEVFIPFGVDKWVLRGEAQFRKHADLARQSVVTATGTAFGKTDAADDQTERRDSLRERWMRAKARAEVGHRTLDALCIHHGSGDTARYVATWVLLIAGDVAAGTLVMVFAGEHPVYAGIMMAALGASAVTTGLLGKDLRRRNLWLNRKDNLPANKKKARIVRDAFEVSDSSWRNTRVIIKAALAAASCLPAASLLYRLVVDVPIIGIAFGLWAVAVGGASFWNSRAHLDPAHTALQNIDATAAKAKTEYVSAPTDAIAARAASLAAAAETLASYEHQGWAAWYTELAAAAEHLRNNPAVGGHGTAGLSYLHKLRPRDEKLFEQLADEFQVPSYAASRSTTTAPGRDAAIVGDPSSDRSTARSVIDLTTILGRRHDEREATGEPTPEANGNGSHTAADDIDAGGDR